MESGQEFRVHGSRLKSALRDGANIASWRKA